MTSANISDTERRDVARRLRDYTVKDLRYSDPICELVCSSEIDCIGFDACCGSDTMPECVKLVFDRLADLIDPDSGHVAQAVEREAGAVTCDRDALLKLAKNLDAQAECRIKSNDIITRRGDRSRNMAVAKDFFGIAREIRNALGVDDGA